MAAVRARAASKSLIRFAAAMAQQRHSSSRGEAEITRFSEVLLLPVTMTFTSCHLPSAAANWRTSGLSPVPLSAPTRSWATYCVDRLPRAKEASVPAAPAFGAAGEIEATSGLNFDKLIRGRWSSEYLNPEIKD